MLNEQQIKEFRRTGHLTLGNAFSDDEIDQAIADIDAWSREFLATLAPADRRWYVERDAGEHGAGEHGAGEHGAGEHGAGERAILRKLDNPVFHRPVFQQLAANRNLLDIIEQLIGAGVSVFFSQVFMKPPEIGGPKPIHQDNFYFGPDDPDATLTVWIALDEATTENGCLYYSDVHQRRLLAHTAPADEPFNLQISAQDAQQFELVAAPVPRGGISVHHGNTLHQSSSNRSQHPRRAAAFHYIRNSASLIHPALAYDAEMSVRMT